MLTHSKSYQFKVILQDVHPPIWRRFRISQSSTIQELALAILDSMQWFGINYFRFILEKSIFFPDYDEDGERSDTHEVYIKSIIDCQSIEFEYTLHDEVGDGWMHTVIFEGEVDDDCDTKGPKCLTGERACPPDDLKQCARGYEEFVSIVMDKNHPERDQTLYDNFVKDDFDSEVFCPNSVVFKKAGPPGTDLEYW